MTPEADELLRNPFWHALCTQHAPISLGGDLARRYPADYIPFAGLAAGDQASFAALHRLLAPGESVFITAEEGAPTPASVRFAEELPCLQMVYPPATSRIVGVLPPEPTGPAEPPSELLGPADLPAMLALKQLAFPGYYGPRAPSLGTYYGIRVEGELVAMAGERLALPGMREVSAVCTHPAHTGRGYAAQLILQLLAVHAAAGLLSFLHVAARNHRAIQLYERLGFMRNRTLIFRRVQRE